MADEISMEKMAGFAVAIIVLAVTLGVGASILANTQTSIGLGVATSLQNNNFTVNTNIAQQNWTFNPSGLENPSAQPSTVVAFNATDATQIYTSGNYTATGSSVHWVAALANGTSVSFNFTQAWNTRNYAYNASNQGLVGLNNMSSFIPVIAIVLILALIIGVLAFIQFRKGGLSG